MTPTQGEHAQTEALRLADALYDGSYLLSVERYTTADELRRLHAQVAALTAAQPAAPQGVAEVNWWEVDGDKYDASISPMQPAQGVAYAELPAKIEPREVRAKLDPTANPDEYALCVGADMWNACVDATQALRASHGQAPAGATDEMAINRPVEDSALPFNQWRGEMQSALKRAGVYAARSPGAGNKLTLRWRATRDDVLPTTTAQAAPATDPLPLEAVSDAEIDRLAGLFIRFDGDCVYGFKEFAEAIIDAARAQPAKAPAAGAVAGPSLQEIQWRNIRKVVDALADFCFGSQDDPRWGVAHVAIRTSLTAKDGLDVQALKLEPLAAPTPAAQADSLLEDAAQESEYRRGYRHGYEQRDAEVRGALA